MDAPLTVFIVLILIAFGTVVCLAVARLSPVFSAKQNVPDVMLSDKSVASRYRPMERLLRESEWKYLELQPGFSSQRIRQIKSERRRLFRQYLRCLSIDFSSLCNLVRHIIVESSTSRPDLAKAVAQLRRQYAFALIRVECRLLVHAVGISSVRVDVSGLVASLEALGHQAKALTLPAPQLDFA